LQLSGYGSSSSNLEASIGVAAATIKSACRGMVDASSIIAASEAFSSSSNIEALTLQQQQ
jgi:hypothetical protein